MSGGAVAPAPEPIAVLKPIGMPAAPAATTPSPVPPPQSMRISFDDTDYAVSTEGKQETISAPKDIPVLEKISEARTQQRKLEDEEDGELSLKIGEEVKLAIGAVSSVEQPKSAGPHIEVQTLE